MYTLAVKLLKRQAKENPNKSFTNSEGEKITIAEVAAKLDTISKWVCPELRSEDVDLVVRCKKCSYYKKYRMKGAKLKPKIVYACSKDKNPRSPMFFCAAGERNDL